MSDEASRAAPGPPGGASRRPPSSEGTQSAGKRQPAGPGQGWSATTLAGYDRCLALVGRLHPGMPATQRSELLARMLRRRMVN